MATVSPSKASTASSPLVQAAGGTLKRSSSKASLTDPKPKRQRTKAGCITCRVRGKKCDEQKVDNGESCETCKRLRLHCLGFQDRRPDWLRTKENIKIWRKRVTEFLMSQGLVKGHAGCGLRPGSTPDASLTLEDMRRDLDAWGAAPSGDSPSAPLQDHERDMEPEHPLGFNGMLGHRDYTLPPLHNISRPSGSDGEDAQYLPKRFENAIGGIAGEDDRDYRWVPPPPFAPLKRYEEDVKYGLPPVGPLTSRPNLNGPPGYGVHPPLSSPTAGRFDPRQDRDMRPPGHIHNSSGSFSSIPDTSSGSRDVSSFPPPSLPPTVSIPPVNPLLSAHDRDRSDQTNAGPIVGASVTGPYNGHSSSNSRNVPIYSQALPTMSPGHHAPYSHPKGVTGYPQQPQAAGYGLPPSDPGHSSGSDRRPLRSHPPPQGRHDSFSQPSGRFDPPQYHPYRTSSHSSGGSFASQGSSHNESPPHTQLSIRTSSISGPLSISSSHFPQSVQSASSSSPDTHNSAYGSYTTPSTATSFNSYPNAGMSIKNLLHASAVGTPASVPPSSGISTMVATPTTAYRGEQNTGETNTTTMAMTYFQGYPSTYAEYTGTQEATFQPLLIQATPTMSRDFYLDRYFNQVIGVQYRLANLQTLPRQMSDLSERSPAVRTSISLLSVLYLEAQQLAQSGVAGTLLGTIDATGRGTLLSDSDPYSNPQYPLLDLGVPGYGFINSSSLLPSNSTNFRAQYDLLYARVKKLLAESKVTKGERYDQGDAMACLHVISAFLFSGGRGDWDQFLQIAAQWVWGCVSDYSGNFAEALREMDSMGRFIFRTTMWMDVFGSISLCKTPRFLQIYRTLFSPGALDTMAESSVETNMDRVMGCPNEVILAFAEIADLEARKDQLVKQLKEGLPAMPAIVNIASTWRFEDTDPRFRWQQEMASLEAEGHQLERLIPEALGPAALPMDRFVEIHPGPPNSFGGSGNQGNAKSQSSQNLEFSGIDLNLFGGTTLEGFWPGISNNNMPPGTSAAPATPAPETDLGGYVDPDEDKRGKIAEVFRNAARVYLHSVISGCDPLVPAIRRAVQATIRALEILGASPLDRSLIFPLTIAGCLAATRDEVAFCITRLSSVGKDAESLGNCFAARLLIESVWKKRTERGVDVNNGVEGGAAVMWRTVMMEMNQNPLLLV